MLNLNSPTVQAMLSNTPQGYGNMPVYYGNMPNVQTDYGVKTPFPSPKDMLSQAGEQMIYSPSPFAQRNLVGGYNPYINSYGYSNPYMGYGGFNQYAQPLDSDSRERIELAMLNGLTYDEQLMQESKLYKTISKIVSKNLERTEEEAEACASYFDIYNKYPKNEERNNKKIKSLHIQLKVGDNVVADLNPNNISLKYEDYSRNSSLVQHMEFRQQMNEIELIKIRNYMYDNAPERQLDKMDLLDFFNNGIGLLIADSMNRKLQEQQRSRVGQTYDRDSFRKRLFENNGIKTKDQLSAMERFTGRYGVMPDGRPVSPGHDPSISTSFSYNQQTGQYDVVAPNFIRDRLERARESFIRSIDNK